MIRRQVGHVKVNAHWWWNTELHQKQAGRSNHADLGLCPEKGSGTEAEVQGSGREIACSLYTSGLDVVSGSETTGEYNMARKSRPDKTIND